MKFGIHIPLCSDFADVRLVIELAREAEQAGWDGFFVWDHLVMDWPDSVADAWMVLTAVALATHHIKIGPLVTPLPRRRPWKLAREATTLDNLSGGRLILGVGIGVYREEFEFLGEPANLKIRAAMLEEGLEILRGLWSGQWFKYEGKHYQIQEMLLRPSPVQTPRIPVWVAGMWPGAKPFQRAAQWDGVFPLGQTLGFTEMMTPEQVGDMVTYIRQYQQSNTPFDIVQCGFTAGTAEDRTIVAPYIDAGVTWWLENLNPWRYGWNWNGRWPVELMRERIQQGPPVC